MSSGDSIRAVAVVVLLLGLSIPALATAHASAGTPVEYSESLTVSTGGTSNVSENATQEEGYGETVNISSNGTELAEGSDYEWDRRNGTVEWLNSNNTSTGDSAEIEYTAYQRTAETQAAWTILSPLLGLFGLFGIVISARAVIDLLGELWQ